MAKSALEYYAEGMNNVVLKNDLGTPSIFVVHGQIKSVDLDASLPDHAHPAFIVNGVTDPALLIGKYDTSEPVEGNTLASLPNMPPTYATASRTYDTMLEQMRAFGSSVTGMTIADHGLLVLLAHKLGYEGHGNTNQGNDYACGTTRYSTGESVTVGTMRVFRGYLYKCLKDHTTSAAMLPHISPLYWQNMGRRYGIMDLSRVSNTNEYNGTVCLTGSGPANWYFMDDLTMEADIVGNVMNNAYGIRLVNCEIQILPDNNAADPEANMAANSSAWRAIKPHANDSDYDLVAPGTEGTVHFTWQNSTLTLDTVAPTFDDGTHSVNFNEVEVNSENIPYVPSILYELGIAPLPGTTVNGKISVKMTNTELMARVGGHYGAMSSAGVAAMVFYNDRSYTTQSSGCRMRARMTAL